MPFLKASSDYKKTVFYFGDIILSTMANTSMALSKLINALSNVQSQLNIEKISSLAKDNKVKSLEDLVIKIGYDPTDFKSTEGIIKKKNTNIVALKK